MKFSIQKGSQIQRLVNESQWPWSEQFNWQAESTGKGKGQHEPEPDWQLPAPVTAPLLCDLWGNSLETHPEGFYSSGVLPVIIATSDKTGAQATEDGSG